MKDAETLFRDKERKEFDVARDPPHICDRHRLPHDLRYVRGPVVADCGTANEVTANLRKHCSPRHTSRKVTPTTPTSSEIVQKLSKSCRAVAPRAKVLGQVGRVFANVGQSWSNVGRNRPNLTNLCTFWPIWARVCKQFWQLSANVVQGWPRFGRICPESIQTRPAWPKVAKLWPKSAVDVGQSFTKFGPTSAKISAPEPTVLQLLDKCWTTSQLDGTAGLNVPAFMASNCSATFGQLHDFCPYRPLQGRGHHKTCAATDRHTGPPLRQNHSATMPESGPPQSPRLSLKHLHEEHVVVTRERRVAVHRRHLVLRGCDLIVQHLHRGMRRASPVTSPSASPTCP